MRFYGCSKDDLDSLQPALTILGQIYDKDDFFPFLFALINQGEVFDVAKEAITDHWEGEEGLEAPTAVAVAIPLSADTLHYLLGSGLYLDGEEFAYLTPGEGSRTGEIPSRARIYMNQITTMAIATDTTWLGDFLDAHAPKQVVEQEVKRSEPIKAEPTAQPAVEASMKLANLPGVDRLLIAGKGLADLQVTELIEVADFVEDHKSGASVYLHFEHEGLEWLVYTKEPAVGLGSLTRVLKSKYGIKEPQIDQLNGTEVEALMESVVDETE
jgi:hypothetical protein